MDPEKTGRVAYPLCGPGLPATEHPWSDIDGALRPIEHRQQAGRGREGRSENGRGRRNHQRHKHRGGGREDKRRMQSQHSCKTPGRGRGRRIIGFDDAERDPPARRVDGVIEHTAVVLELALEKQ